MKTVLSIRQPWAWLIVSGAKDIENRDWPTRFRGEFHVHAGKYKPANDELSAIERQYGIRINRCDLQYGGVIGTVWLDDCVESHASKWFVGDYGFVLSRPCPVPFVPLTGRLGFFKVA